MKMPSRFLHREVNGTLCVCVETNEALYLTILLTLLSLVTLLILRIVRATASIRCSGSGSGSALVAFCMA